MSDYIKKAWVTGDTIQAVDLNNMENGIDNSHSELDNKVDKVTGKDLSTNDYTTLEKTKLAGIEESANNYSHPSTHNASMIVEDNTHRFVTDTERTNWNNVVSGGTTQILFPIKGVAIGDTYGYDSSTTLKTRIQRCGEIGCNALELVPVVEVGTDGLTFTYDCPDNWIVDMVNYAKPYGLQPSMLAPHIRTGDANLHRDPTITGHEATFFANMKTMLLKYAQIAFDNGFEYLCVLSESYIIENAQYLSYWQEIISAIRTQNPTQKLAVSQVSDDSCLFPLVDIIGCNQYGGLNTSVSWQNYSSYTIEDDFTVKKGLNSVLQKIHTYYKKYGKPYFFGEMGEWGGTPGKGYSSSVLYPADHSAWQSELQALWYRNFLEIFTQTSPEEFVGGYIWGIDDWNQNNDHYSPIGNPAETYVEKYYKGV